MSRWTTNKEAWQLLFDKYNIPYTLMSGTEEGYKIILDTILYKMNKTRNDRVDINYVGD